MSRNSQTVSLGPWVDSQISDGFDMETDYIKMSEFTHKHLPLLFFKLKICFAHCVFNLRNARHPMFSANRRTCMNLTFCVSP